jgi:hypothetical protein
VQVQSGVNLTGQRTQTFGLALNSAKIPGTTQNISATSLLGTPNITLSPTLTCDPRSNLGPNQFINASCFSFPNQIGQNGPTTLPTIYGPAFFNTDIGLFKNFKIAEKKSFQLRMNGYNFLNHPLWSFNGGNLNLGFTGATGILNTPHSGTMTKKQRQRCELAATFCLTEAGAALPTTILRAILKHVNRLIQRMLLGSLSRYSRLLVRAARCH